MIQLKRIILPKLIDKTSHKGITKEQLTKIEPNIYDNIFGCFKHNYEIPKIQKSDYMYLVASKLKWTTFANK